MKEPEKTYDQKLASLTEKEREVMGYVLKDLNSRQIAEILGISPRTVESHREKCIRKMGATSILGLAKMVWCR
jgi:two-component system response regulator FixJ